MGQVIQIDEARIRDHLGEMNRGTVEETLNAMLDAEADRLCAAGRYERNEARQDTRAGSYDRTLQTSAGEVNPKVPKLRRQTFETASGPCERFAGGPASLERSPTANHASTWLPHDCSTSSATAWSTKCYMNMRPLYQPQLMQTEAVA